MPLAKNCSFARLMQARAELGTGQIMLRRVDIDVLESCGIVDLNGEALSIFLSLKFNGPFGKNTAKSPIELNDRRSIRSSFSGY